MIKLLFFGRLGELAKTAPNDIQFKSGLTPRSVRELLAADFPELVAELDQPQVLIAVNQTIVDWNHFLEDGVELAFLPPVTGG